MKLDISGIVGQLEVASMNAKTTFIQLVIGLTASEKHRIVKQRNNLKLP
jgi:hypothetical protein